MPSWDRIDYFAHQTVAPVQNSLTILETITGQKFKPKHANLRMFGRALNASANVPASVASLPAGLDNESYTTLNNIDSADTGEIIIEGCILNDNGSVWSYDIAVQTIALNGQTPVALTTPLVRVNRVSRPLGVETMLTYQEADQLQGAVSVYSSADTSGITSGVVDTPEAVRGYIPAGKQHTEKAAATISRVDAWLITGVGAAIARETANSVNVDLELEQRQFRGVFQPAGLGMSLRADGTNAMQVHPVEPFVIFPNSDVRLVATSSADNTVVSGYLEGQLFTMVNPPELPPAPAPKGGK